MYSMTFPKTVSRVEEGIMAGLHSVGEYQFRESELMRWLPLLLGRKGVLYI